MQKTEPFIHTENVQKLYKIYTESIQKIYRKYFCVFSVYFLDPLFFIGYQVPINRCKKGFPQTYSNTTYEDSNSLRYVYRHTKEEEIMLKFIKKV